MSREIKFRIYHEGKFHYWGFLGNGFTGIPSFHPNVLSMQELKEKSEQFIGMSDKNGKEIYKVDIVEIKKYKRLGKVIYKGVGFKLKLIKNWQSWGNQPSIVSFATYEKECEVTGNIYENKDLL